VQNGALGAARDFCRPHAIPMLVSRFGRRRNGHRRADRRRWRGASVIIFDCNGVLVDSEQIATTVAADAFLRIGIPLTPELISRYFFGRRPADMFATVEAATRRKLPTGFASVVAATTLRRLRTELRAMPHAAHALTWLRGPKCVASSSPPDRIRASLTAAGLERFFDYCFSASDVPHGKPAPDLFLHAASHMGVQASDCIVVEDSPAGVNAAAAAGITAIGFVGGGHAGVQLGEQLILAGAHTIVADLRHLKSVVVAIRGW
jgi:HAD superfamily hydrolase (TIGR01509 family)